MNHTRTLFVLVLIGSSATALGLAAGRVFRDVDVVAKPALKEAYEVSSGPAQPRRLVVHTGQFAADGSEILVNCTTCHAARQPNLARRDGAKLEHYHQGLVTQHGGLTCLSCHDATDYRQLKLADGTGVQAADAMQLCAQCHGPQTRDYLHGSHGGMRGHWDKSKGGRERNDCLQCHDAHHPAFPTFMPVHLPRDRFLSSPHDSEHEAK